MRAILLWSAVSTLLINACVEPLAALPYHYIVSAVSPVLQSHGYSEINAWGIVTLGIGAVQTIGLFLLLVAASFYLRCHPKT